MAQVYVLSEDGFDDQVYVYVLESLLGTRVEPVPLRLRRGGGIGEVRKKLPLLVSLIRRTGPVEDTYFVVAVDNDRAPPHAAHAGTAPHARACRHCQIMDAIHDGMPDGWPLPGAVAVPVEMIEAWLLLMYDPVRYAREPDLPACARRGQAVARERYGADPPPQLKDLVDKELADLADKEKLGARNATKADFALACVLRLDPASLADRAPSFAHFRDQVSGWGAEG